jgi:hypothetical protein
MKASALVVVNCKRFSNVLIELSVTQKRRIFGPKREEETG